MKRWNCILGLAVTACLLNFANAEKPGGGKGDPEPSPVIELSADQGAVWSINNEQAGSIEAVGELQPVANYQAFYSKIDNAGNVLEFRLLRLAAPNGCIAEESRAWGINQSGTAVGYAGEYRSWESNQDVRVLLSWPLLWANSTSVPFLLPLPDGFENYSAAAESINDDGIVVGHIWKELDNAVIAWKVDLSGELPQVKDCITFLHSTPYSPFLDGVHWPTNRLTEFGLGIANVREPDDGYAYRFLLEFDDNTDELMVETERLFAAGASAYAINDFGTVGGLYYPTLSAFAVDLAGNSQFLEELPSAREKSVTVEYTNWSVGAINNQEIKIGRIIGIATKYGNIWGFYPAMWDANGTLTLLHKDWKQGFDINDAGWIGGQSSNRCPAIELP